MSTPSMRPRRHGSDRMLAIRMTLALGLALLLVIGAWSTSHGEADAHAALCVAPGTASISASGSDSASGHHDGGVTVVEAVSSDTGMTAIAALCCILLVLVFLRLGLSPRLLLRNRRVVASVPTRAGPRLHVPALTLTQLSLSRT